MKVKYVGPHTGVSVPTYRLVVEKGVAVEVPEEQGKALLASVNWQAAEEKKEIKKEGTK